MQPQLQFALDSSTSIEDMKFFDAIQKLGPPFETNQQLYEDFFNLYGTHYISKMEFGGIFRLEVEILASYYHSRNGTELGSKTIIDYLRRHLDYTFGLSKKDAPAEFLSSRNSKILKHFVGGKDKDVRNITKWIDSIKYERMPVRIELEPFSKHRYAANKTSLELAYQTIMFKHELQQWNRTLTYIRDTPTGQFLSGYLYREPWRHIEWLRKNYLEKKPYPKPDKLYSEKMFKFMKDDVNACIYTHCCSTECH